MRALCWYGRGDVRVERVPDPELLNPRDAIVKVTRTAICGSDLHLYDAYIPTMRKGDILGHEFMGEVVEVGSGVNNLAVGDRVVVPFPIACGGCYFCHRHLWSLCDNSNPNARLAEALFGHAPAGIFGYSHLMGGYAGGQAEYVRVPFADVGPLKVPESLSDDQVLFLTDIFPTGYQAVEVCDLKGGETVAVWGCGPVGQFAIKSAWMLGAERVIAIDRVPERLKMAKEQGGAEVINYEEVNARDALTALTGGRGPDVCIEAVGMEAHGMGAAGVYDRLKQELKVETGRPHALREAILACRKGGVVSVAGVFGGFVDKLPMGAAFNKGLTFKMGQTHVHRYLKPLLARIEDGTIDPSFVITHRISLDDAPAGYKMFRDKRDGCIKVVLQP
jgi:threonine dehydrogenase-like Zn-dependent dehydrogenase